MAENNSEKIEKVFRHALIVKNYHKVFEDLKNRKIIFNSEPGEIDITEKLKSSADAKVILLEDVASIPLNPTRGYDFVQSYVESFAAYDESIQKIDTLKGTVYFTCHCMIRLSINDYEPICELTANYFTRSKKVASKSTVFHYVDFERKETIESLYKIQYHNERNSFIKSNIYPNSILIIDGPLIGRMLSSRTIKMAKYLLDRKVLTVYITKNSDSMMLSNHVANGLYNSDLDWAHDNLEVGCRSPFVQYWDKDAGHSETFCYLKTFENASPLRISFLPKLLEIDSVLMKQVMNAIYYMVLNQGTSWDPQFRLISIAEYFAKDIMKVANPYGKMISMGLVPTVNQSRWGRK